MADLAQIEKLAQDYAEAYNRLASDVQILQIAINDIKRKMLKVIRASAAQAADRKKALNDAVAGSQDIFQKPKTRVIHGVKVGFRKSEGKVMWDDEAKVVARIERLLPAEQAELLLRRETHVHKEGVYDLSVADLKRFGIEIVGAGDVPVVKIAGSDVERIVDALLAGDEVDA